MTTTSNNTWGFDFNEAGDVFGSTANNAHGWYMPIPHRNIYQAPFSFNGSKNTDTHKDMKTITKKYVRWMFLGVTRLPRGIIFIRRGPSRNHIGIKLPL